jgi:hypothetical protein
MTRTIRRIALEMVVGAAIIIGAEVALHLKFQNKMKPWEYPLYGVIGALAGAYPTRRDYITE